MSSLKEKPPAPQKTNLPLGDKPEEFSAVWAEARLVYPLYFFLATHFKLETPLTSQAELPVHCPTPEVFECVRRWLELMETRIRANQLRQLLHSVKDIKAESLCAVILRLLRRPVKTTIDRDNIDLLLATYFALCAPEDLYACEITLADVAQVLHSVLPDADSTELEWCAPLNQILEATKQCRGLHDVFAGKLLEKGRELKDAAGFMFYDPAALVAFTRFNFLLRRAFFRLLHADLRAIREGLTELERRGIPTVDCRSAGLSAQEPIAHLREISLTWRQPIRSDYAEESANHTFERLLAIRAAVERALGIFLGDLNLPAISAGLDAKPEPNPSAIRQPAATPKLAQSAKSEIKSPREKVLAADVGAKPVPRASAAGQQLESPRTRNQSPAAMPQMPASGTSQPASAGNSAPPAGAAPVANEKKSTAANPSRTTPGNAPSPELEQCLENIWEQLIEAPPARGRSMSTVPLGNTRVLLSAWEVSAFVSDGGQVSDDLRRAVAARALIGLAREEQKNSGNSQKFDSAIAQGRQEMIYLQERVEQAQQAKNTEAAVNLGISARRLLSAIEEAVQK